MGAHHERGPGGGQQQRRRGEARTGRCGAWMAAATGDGGAERLQCLEVGLKGPLIMCVEGMTG